MSTSNRFLLLVLSLISITPVAAHDTWIAPNAFAVEQAAGVTLSLTSGMEFPKLDHAIQADRIAVAKLRTSRGRTSGLEAAGRGPNALEFRSRLKTRGVTLFWVVLKPRAAELQADQVREYVEHLGLAHPQRIITEWERKSAPKQFRYRYTKYAKTFVHVGDGDAGRQWSRPAGMRLELVPEDDPTTREAGKNIRFILLIENRPLRNYPVFVVAEEGSKPVSYQTDEAGRVRIELPRSGRYMIRATTLEPSAARETEWDVHFTTAVLRVR